MLMPIFDDLKKKHLYYNVLANIIFCFRHKKHVLPPGKLKNALWWTKYVTLTLTTWLNYVVLFFL